MFPLTLNSKDHLKLQMYHSVNIFTKKKYFPPFIEVFASGNPPPPPLQTFMPVLDLLLF